MVDITADQKTILDKLNRLACSLSNRYYIATEGPCLSVDKEIDLALMFLKDIAPDLEKMIVHYKAHGNLRRLYSFYIIKVYHVKHKVIYA